jgi:hypothetical protein
MVALRKRTGAWIYAVLLLMWKQSLGDDSLGGWRRKGAEFSLRSSRQASALSMCDAPFLGKQVTFSMETDAHWTVGKQR